MPVVRKWLAQPEVQILRVDHPSRFLHNSGPHWQPLFGPNSALRASTQVLKLAAELDTATFDKIRLAGYLYRPATGGIDTTASLTFRVFMTQNSLTPKWDDVSLLTVAGVLQTNGYFYAEAGIGALTGAELDGDTTLMVEGVAVRAEQTYRDRIYINHLGSYDSILRLKQDIEYLDIIKVTE